MWVSFLMTLVYSTVTLLVTLRDVPGTIKPGTDRKKAKDFTVEVY